MCFFLVCVMLLFFWFVSCCCFSVWVLRSLFSVCCNFNVFVLAVILMRFSVWCKIYDVLFVWYVDVCLVWCCLLVCCCLFVCCCFVGMLLFVAVRWYVVDFLFGGMLLIFCSVVFICATVYCNLYDCLLGCNGFLCLHDFSSWCNL